MEKIYARDTLQVIYSWNGVHSKSHTHKYSKKHWEDEVDFKLHHM
jgi:hypothetical protein